MQLDFGRFEPAFYGATLHFSSPRAWDWFRRFNASATPIRPFDLPDDECFEALAVVTSLAHEIRHFHDALLSPHSAHVAAARMKLALNVIQLLRPLVQAEGNCLLLPLSRWCRMSEAERREELRALPDRADGKEWRPIPIPHIENTSSSAVPPGDSQGEDDEVVVRLLRSALGYAEQINELVTEPLTRGAAFPVQPRHAFELSATLVQAGQLVQMYGSEGANHFLTFLQNRTTPYGELLRWLKHIFDSVRSGFHLPHVVALATWCMLGNYHSDGANACPARRLIHLAGNLMSGSAPLDGLHSVDLMEEWSRSTGLNQAAVGVEETRAVLRELRAAMASRAADAAAAGSFVEEFALVARIAAGLQRASEQAIDWFLENPLRYFHPTEYDRALHELPNPRVRIAFEGGGLPLRGYGAALEADGYTIEWAVENDKGGYIASLLAPYRFSPHSYVSPQDASYFATLLLQADYLFAVSGRTRPEFAYAKGLAAREFARRGIEVLEIL